MPFVVVRPSESRATLYRHTREVTMAPDKRQYGAVFTRRWVVDLMLDTSGYTPDKNLAGTVAVEPSCGDGAFLLPMVERLSASLKKHGQDITDAREAIKAFDLQKQHVLFCRDAVTELLVSEGWEPAVSREIADGWVHHADYLLTEHKKNADFAIGNPPYIRSDDMTPELRAAYMSRCETMTTGSDIYIGFIEQGLKSLKPNGVLSYICADRWMHNNYGKKLRGFVIRDYGIEVIYEMHGVDAFAEDVSAYPAITQIRNSHQGAVRFVVCAETFKEEAARRLYKWASQDNPAPLNNHDFKAALLPKWFDTDAVWASASPERLALLEVLNDKFRPLEDPKTGTKIGIGVATGADKIFVIQDMDLVESERLVPLVITDHVRKCEMAWKNTWLVNPWNEDGSLVDLTKYPKMARYLSPFKTSLQQRHTAKKNTDAWYRTIDKVNPTLTKKPKLLLQDMKATIQPIYDKGDYYPHHNLYWITSEKWNLEVLGGLLLSRVAEMFIAAYGVKMRGGTLRFQAQYLRLVRVPDPDTIPDDIQARLVQAFKERNADEATQAALVAYGLDELPD